jgi:hypothetical protein
MPMNTSRCYPRKEKSPLRRYPMPLFFKSAYGFTGLAKMLFEAALQNGGNFTF